MANTVIITTKTTDALTVGDLIHTDSDAGEDLMHIVTGVDDINVFLRSNGADYTIPNDGGAVELLATIN